MKKVISLLLSLCMLVPSLALAKTKDEPIPDFCKPILEAWDAANSKELAESIRQHWGANVLDEWGASLYTAKRRPIDFKFGGTTKELIKTHKKWDIAIVSSKDVDLQELADAGCIMHQSNLPTENIALHTFLLPDAVLDKLPVHPLFNYLAFCYQYDPETDEAIFLICNNKGRPSARARHGFVVQLLNRRSAEQVRALEQVNRINYWWRDEGVKEPTPDMLLQSPDAWDWATFEIDMDDKLETLDQAGLLYDFSQDEYWTDRAPNWKEPVGHFSADGRMIAIPFDRITGSDTSPHSMRVFIVNAKSPNLARTLEYAKHFIKSCEWIYDIPADWRNVEIEKKYGEYSICILKDDVDW